MIWIRQKLIPTEFAQWKAGNKGINFNYSSLPGEIKKILKQSLLEEQHYLCAYTMLRINGEKSHIEHIEPQSISNHKDLEYTNLLACYPGVDMGMIEYGAKPKDNSAERIISPHDRIVDESFYYSSNGTIVGKNELAERTIFVLNLNHRELKKSREETYSRFAKILIKNKIPLSAANKMLNSMLEREKLPEQFGVIRQILRKYIQKLEARANRVKGVQRN